MEIKFDISESIDEFSLTDAQVRDILTSTSQAVTLEIYRNWSDAAKKELKSTRSGYISGLNIHQIDYKTNDIVLTGTLNMMLEDGASPFDLKAGFMKSGKVKYNKKGGWYITIPFRWGVPGSLGENEVFAGVLPQEVYDIIKNKQGSQTDVGGNKTSGGRISLSELPKEYQIPKTRAAIETIGRTFAAYTNKNPIFQGVGKDTSSYNGGTQNTYNSFRRAGENGDPMSWIHTGIKAYKLADKGLANTDVRTVVDNTVDKILKGYGF